VRRDQPLVPAERVTAPQTMGPGANVRTQESLVVMMSTPRVRLRGAAVRRREQRDRSARDRSTAPVVVGTDGSDSSLAAVDWGATEAARRGVPLNIIHVLDYGSGSKHAHVLGHELAGLLRHQLRYQAKSAMARARRRAEITPGLDVQAATVVGRAAEVLTAISARTSLLVIGCRGAGEASWPRLGSVAGHLASRARCPVVFTSVESHPAVNEIVVDADGSDDAPAVLEFGFGEADMRHGRLTALNAWAHPGAGWPDNDGRWLLSVGEPNDGADGVLHEQVAPWRHKYPDVPVTESAVHGYPGRVLAVASNSADLVVVGGHQCEVTHVPGLGLVGSALLGHAHCPVVLIPG
jgi:nucleotide-binding universal stress UspA family protein